MDKRMLRQAQELQAKLAKAQEELGDLTVEGSAGGGAVTVVADGHQNVRSIKISPDAVDPEDIGLLEDLILAAVNDSLEKSQKMAQDRLGSLTGNLKIPGLF
jgi:DNA-binding YbaB/EbfC family protein